MTRFTAAHWYENVKRCTPERLRHSSNPHRSCWRFAALIVAAGLLAAGCRASGAASASAPAARRYRDATKHSPESVRADTFRLDWQNKPTLYRTYADAETVALAAPRRLTQAALDALVARAAAPAGGALDLDTLGTLLFLGSLIETYIIVHAVTDVAPGAYYYRASDQRLEQLAAGDFRNTAGFLSLNQALARDASAVIYYMADLTRIGSAFGERGYRLAELEAGLRAGRAYLAAYAVGRGASGLTFFDDEVTRFFSPHAAGLEPLLVVAVGTPRKR